MTRRRAPQQADLLAELPPISYVWETPNRRPRRAEWDTPDPAVPRRLTPAMRAKLERIVSRVPEVMVKITGRTKGVAHLRSHLAYITRNGELDAETEQGAAMTGRAGLKDLQQRWEDDAVLDDKRRRDGSLSINVRQTFRPGANGLPESFGFVGSRRRRHRDEPGDEFEKPTAGRCWPCASERLRPRSIGWRGKRSSAK
jgi:hypothetical protein